MSLSKERIEALCTDGMYAGVNGDQDEWAELQALALKALQPEARRVLFDCDEFCPGCGHNRDKSSVSTIDHEDGTKQCQMCGAWWEERLQPQKDES